MSETFKALVVEETEKGRFERRVQDRNLKQLPAGDLLVRVRYSSLNYKDALSASGHKGVTRRFPHTPGIDAAGEVLRCDNGTFQPGDRVIVHGHDLGMNTSGGFGQQIRVPSDWAVRLPVGLSLREAMIIGTAGFTAAHSVFRLMAAGVTPDDGDILVTGATGGVGSMAVSILANEGFRIVGSTGKSESSDFLKNLGASEVISRAKIQDTSDRPLLKTRWAGVIDSVGGSTLTTAIRATQYGGAVTCCGLTESADLPLTVYPFILRGVSLIGIDSAECSIEIRRKLWQRLGDDWKPENLDAYATDTDLNGLEEKIRAILKGEIQGRTVVDLGP